ncbi:MAG: hypothetical protein J0I23_20480 [Rhizobiales bacterium]|nr:hypothetical protein [Hyphomicrobiales bacterium]
MSLQKKMKEIQAIARFLIFLLQAVLTVGGSRAYKQLINEGGAVACE